MQQLAKLRLLLHEMETDIGLAPLTRNERDILIAFYELSHQVNDKRTCSTEVVRTHPTLRSMSQPTFHRTLRKLVSKGMVFRSGDLPLGVYELPRS